MSPYRRRATVARGKRRAVDRTPAPTERGVLGHVCACGLTPTREPDEVRPCCEDEGEGT